jgi:hypothetical protein
LAGIAAARREPSAADQIAPKLRKKLKLFGNCRLRSGFLAGAPSPTGSDLSEPTPAAFWRIKPNVGVLAEPTQRAGRTILAEQTRLEKAQ